MWVRIPLAPQQLNLEIMARELSKETVDFTYVHLKKYPYCSPSEITGIVGLKGYEDESGLRYMELRALVIKEMDRAKKRVKEECKV